MSPPYAAPLSATDRVDVEARADGRLLVRARKRISAEDPYQAAHFPGNLHYPGVFVVETVRQAVVAGLDTGDGRLPDLVAIRSVRFLAALHIGDELWVAVTLDPPGPGGVRTATARCRYAGGAEVARLVAEFGYPDGPDA